MASEWETVSDDGWETVPAKKTGRKAIVEDMHEKQRFKESSELSDYERELQLRGPGAQQRAEEAKDMPWHEKALLLAADETKSLTSGVQSTRDSSINDIARLVFGSMITPGGGGLFERDSEDRKKTKEEVSEYFNNRNVEKELFREVDESAGLTQIARALPYLVTGAAEAPLSNAYRSGVKGITDITRKGIPSTINATGRPTILPEYASVATLGAIEGASHDSDSFEEGATSSLIGKFGGRALGNYLEKAHNENSAFDNDLIERFRQKGYVASPGMRTGNRKEQRNDAVQSTDPRFSGWYDEKNRSNNEILLNDIKQSAGFGSVPNGDLSTLPPERINAHITSLRNEYQELENKTRGKIPASDFIEVKDIIESLPEADVARIKKDFIRFTGGKRDNNGRLRIGDREFDGSTYQDQLRRLKDGKAWAISQTNRPLAQAYDKMIESLASGLEGGMKSNQVERWRDLNERWAMSKLIIDKGLDATNKIDANKILDNITSTDMDRLVTGKGGRIRGFHDVVRMRSLEKQQQSPGMGEGISDLSKRDKKRRESGKPSFFSGPEKSQTRPSDNLMMNLQYGGLFGQPRKVYGLLGNPREGILSTGSVSRAIEQGTDSKLNLLNYVTDKKDKAKNYVEEIWYGKYNK